MSRGAISDTVSPARAGMDPPEFELSSKTAGPAAPGRHRGHARPGTGGKGDDVLPGQVPLLELAELRDALKRELKIDTTTSKKKAAIRSRGEFQLGMGLTP